MNFDRCIFTNTSPCIEIKWPPLIFKEGSEYRNTHTKSRLKSDGLIKDRKDILAQMNETEIVQVTILNIVYLISFSYIDQWPLCLCRASFYRHLFPLV